MSKIATAVCFMSIFYMQSVVAGAEPVYLSGPKSVIADTYLASVTEPLPKPAELSVSSSSLSLAANGVPRTLIITASKGDALAVDYMINSALPNGTTITPASCGNINEGTSCILTITPGAIPSATAGSAAQPAVIKIQGINTNALSAEVSVLAQGNIYHQGYIYHLDDTTPVTEGVGGSVVSLVDVKSAIQWYNGSDMVTNAASLMDGKANTIAINSAQGAGEYAAAVCANYEIDSALNSPCQTGNTCYKNWYLPAICQMGPETSSSGCVANTPNIAENLVHKSLGGFSSTDNYWSSTEFSANPLSFVWYQFFGSSSNVSFQSVSNKYINLYAIRCVRDITH